MPTERGERISKLKEQYNNEVAALNRKEWEIQDRIRPLKDQIHALWQELAEYKSNNRFRRHELMDLILKLEQGGDL